VAVSWVAAYLATVPLNRAVSVPLPPFSVSLPASPRRVSLPSPPVRVLASWLPRMLSFSVPPMAFSISERRSLFR